MKLERLKVPKDVAAQSKFLNRAMVAGWVFKCECINFGLETDANGIQFIAKVRPPKWLTDKFGTLFLTRSYDDSTDQISGFSLLEIMSSACDYIAECYNDIKQELELSADFWNVCANDIKGVRVCETQKEEKISN